jgi:hypothetical protein
MTLSEMRTRLHPGESPLDYRTRIGHRPEDPRTWGPLDTNPDATPGGCHVQHKCGCEVVGTGTLPYPYTVLRCALHEHALAAQAGEDGWQARLAEVLAKTGGGR